jgi:DNA-directed RNA polymerase subunit RPC12/RpoP
MELKIIGPYSYKLYKCSNCKITHTIGTNHWGEVYSRCPNCSWKTPREIHPQICQEPVPEGYTTSDIMEVI